MRPPDRGLKAPDQKWHPHQAEDKYNEALAVKGEHVDVLQYLANLEMERAKLAAGINVGSRCARRHSV